MSTLTRWLLAALLLAACTPRPAPPPGPPPAPPRLESPTSLTRAPDGALVVVDRGAVWSLQTDSRELGTLLPRGPIQPGGAVVDEDGRLFLTDRPGHRLLALDPGAAEPSLVSGPGRGAGPPLQHPGRLVLLADGRIAVVSDGTVLAVDPGTGDRAPLAAGQGPDIRDPVDLVFLRRGTVMVLDAFQRALIEVDPATGNRRLAADLAGGPAPALSAPRGLGLSPDGQILLADHDTCRVVSLDLATGHRRVLDTPARPGPSWLGEVADVEGLPDDTAAVTTPGAVVQVKFDTNREVLAGSAPDTGSAAAIPCALALLPDGGLLATDLLHSRVIRLDPATGRFREVSGHEEGTGGNLDLPMGLAAAPDGKTAYVADPGQGVVQVDLATGNRSRLSGPGKGSGPPLRQADGVAVDARGRLFAVDRSTGLLHLVDRKDGKRAAVYSGRLGKGPALQGPVALAAVGTNLLVADHLGGAVVQVDPDLPAGREVLRVPGPASLFPLAGGEALVGAGPSGDEGQVLLLPGPGRSTPLTKVPRVPGGLARVAGQVVATQPGGRGEFLRIDPQGRPTAVRAHPEASR